MDIMSILYKAEFFKGISENSRRALADICLSKTLSKKEFLFIEGDVGHSIFLCVKGNIQLHKTTADGKEIVIKVIKSGDIFGEVILFEETNYPVSAVALDNSQVFILPKHQFHSLLNNDDFRNDFIGMLLRKQRYLTNQIKYLMSHDVEDRLFSFLKEHFGQQNRIVCSLSKKDVSAAIGATPETLSRLLLRLKKEKKLRWEGKIITVNEKARILPKK